MVNPTRRGTEGRCNNCGKKYTRKRDNQRYCGIHCANIHQYKIGERDKIETIKKAQETIRQKGMEKFNKSPTMKIGKRGYLEIYIPILTAKQKGLPIGWLKYHHYIWWKHKGKLPPVNAQMHIHHKDSNKLNNVIENLELISSSQHMKNHWKEWKAERKGIFK